MKRVLLFALVISGTAFSLPPKKLTGTISGVVTTPSTSNLTTVWLPSTFTVDEKPKPKAIFTINADDGTFILRGKVIATDKEAAEIIVEKMNRATMNQPCFTNVSGEAH